MDRAASKELKAAGFPIKAYQPRHKFYPNENAAGWPEAIFRNGVTVTPYELKNRLQDINNGYYCPTLSDLIGACGGQVFASVCHESDLVCGERRAGACRHGRHAGRGRRQAVARFESARLLPSEIRSSGRVGSSAPG